MGTSFTQARTCSQWLSELRRQVHCSLTSCVSAHFLVGSHTMPGQHSQPTLTLLGHDHKSSALPSYASPFCGLFRKLSILPGHLYRQKSCLFKIWITTYPHPHPTLPFYFIYVCVCIFERGPQVIQVGLKT